MFLCCSLALGEKASLWEVPGMQTTPFYIIRNSYVKQTKVEKVGEKISLLFLVSIFIEVQVLVHTRYKKCINREKCLNFTLHYSIKEFIVIYCHSPLYYFITYDTADLFSFSNFV